MKGLFQTALMHLKNFPHINLVSVFKEKILDMIRVSGEEGVSDACETF
jgi:hypothetical protein